MFGNFSQTKIATQRPIRSQSRAASSAAAISGLLLTIITLLSAVSAHADFSGTFRCEVRECRMTRSDQKLNYDEPHAGMKFSACDSKMNKIKMVAIDGYIVTYGKTMISGRGFSKIWALGADGKTIQYLSNKSDYGYGISANSDDTVYLAFNQSEGRGIFASSDSPWAIELTMSCAFPSDK